MDIFSKKRLTAWAIGILIVLNLLTISLFWYREYKSQSFERREPKMEKQFRHERLLKKELGFSQEQIDKYKKLSANFFEKTRQHRTSIDILKHQVFDQVFNETPDSKKVDELGKQLGQLESELSNIVFQHFLQVKTICNLDQQQKMQVLFKDLFRRSRPPRHLDPDFKKHKSFRNDGRPRGRPPGDFDQP